jgi:hypothetical protein
MHLNYRIVKPAKNIDFSVAFPRQLKCCLESINLSTLGVLCDNDLDITEEMHFPYPKQGKQHED